MFLTFKEMNIQKEFLLISFISFLMLNSFYVVGSLANRVFRLNDIMLPFIVTGFSFGLLGVPLFEGVYGIENLSDISILGIGNEFFLWFVYITLLRNELGRQNFSAKVLLDFVKSPLVISIISGLVLNLSGLNSCFNEFILFQGLNRTLEYIGTMTTPIILIITGYGIKLNKKYLKGATKVLIIRLIIIFGVGYLIKLLIINPYIQISAVFDLAFFTFLALPPPFSLVIFMGEYCSDEEVSIANNAIVLSTLVCLVLFVGMVVFAN